jgi:hypothetical protein
VEVCRCLLDHGASLDLTAPRGSTALHIACGADRTGVVDLLLSRGADVSISASGATPLALACCLGHIASVRSLLRDGRSDMEARPEPPRGPTPVLTAAAGGFPGIMRLLLLEGADPVAGGDTVCFAALGNLLRAMPKCNLVFQVGSALISLWMRGLTYRPHHSG